MGTVVFWLNIYWNLFSKFSIFSAGWNFDDRISCGYAENRADSRFVPSQWETPLQSNTVSHWLGANLETALQNYLSRVSQSMWYWTHTVDKPMRKVDGKASFRWYCKHRPGQQINISWHVTCWEIALKLSVLNYFAKSKVCCRWTRYSVITSLYVMRDFDT